MTTNTERSAIFAGVPEGRCHDGAMTDNPCPRMATEYRWLDSPEPTLCPEHARVAHLADELDDIIDALEQLQEWIKDAPKEKTALINAVYDQRDALERSYLEVAAKFRGAEMIADGVKLGSGSSARREYSTLSLEQAEQVARANMRADAFNNARAILEDVPEEVFGAHKRWEICAVLEDAHRSASAGQ